MVKLLSYKNTWVVYTYFDENARTQSAENPCNLLEKIV